MVVYLQVCFFTKPKNSNNVMISYICRVCVLALWADIYYIFCHIPNIPGKATLYPVAYKKKLPLLIHPTKLDLIFFGTKFSFSSLDFLPNLYSFPQKFHFCPSMLCYHQKSILEISKKNHVIYLNIKYNTC